MFFRRCFGMKKLSFADDAQEIIFLNYLEDRWETISSQYNLHEDRPKALLREQVLEFIDERLELLESLKSMDLNPEQLPKKEMNKLAEVSIYFIELLEVLNSENHTLQDDDSEELAEAIGKMGEIQNEQIASINSYLKI
jgi:5-bromo-4-chloroindolyl phosphate hydrolysis protein